MLRDRARGIDPRGLETTSERISISVEETFERDWTTRRSARRVAPDGGRGRRVPAPRRPLGAHGHREAPLRRLLDPQPLDEPDAGSTIRRGSASWRAPCSTAACATAPVRSGSSASASRVSRSTGSSAWTSRARSRPWSARADVEVAVVGAGVMGLAAARALAQAGHDVVLCEQFAVGHDRGSSHGGSRIVRLSYPDERWVRLAQESLPALARARGRAGPARCSSSTGRSTSATGSRTAMRWPRAGSRSRCSTRPRSGAASGSALEAGESGLFQADGGIVCADLALQALLESARACRCAGARADARSTRWRTDGDLVSLGGLRARAAPS